MLNFVAKAFRGFMKFILAFTLFGFIIAGGIIFILNSENAIFGFIIGGIIGGIIGLIIVVLTGGFIANFLRMADNIEKMAKDQIGETS